MENEIKLRMCKLEHPAECPKQVKVVNLIKDEIDEAFGWSPSVILCSHAVPSCSYGVEMNLEASNGK